MNITSILEENWFNDIQFGNKGAALFIIAYIGFYGFIIICLFAQQLKETQRQRHELPAYFLKTLWDVPNKHKIYRLYKLKLIYFNLNFFFGSLEELADVERLKRIFRAYFADHEIYITTGNDDLQAIVDERAHACALRYRQKLRRLHLSHTDYCLDTLQNFIHDDRPSITSTHTSIKNLIIDYTDREKNEDKILSISVV